LFQFEIWRRQALGNLSEILGSRELDRDIGVRLFKFRGDIDDELNHYHPEGKQIIESFVSGVNAYIDEILKTPKKLPLPFKMLGIKPQKWTPEVVISRHQGLLGNIGQELQIGRAVAIIGEKKVKELLWFHPKEPKIELDKKINKQLLFENILKPYFDFRKDVKFIKEDLVEKYQDKDSLKIANFINYKAEDSLQIGSNNWVVSGSKTKDKNTYMANDPHRKVAVPSLRYMAHLIAPGWNVLGGGEPEIPGISIGHNEYGAWGLTVFRTDGEDLYQYKLNPKDPSKYWYKGKWLKFKVIEEEILVKGESPKKIELNYSIHGPVTYINKEKSVAFGVRCAWLEIGGSPYLASLRMDQAKTWEEFRAACNYSNIPGENMIWADKTGNIGWQSVGIAPIRRNFSGLVPVPGDGSYEWDGYLPIIEKPHKKNPANGFFATANQNVIPRDYKKWDAIGFSWSDPYRGERVNQVLSENDSLTMKDMKDLQVDVTSLPAKKLIPYLDNIDLNVEQREFRDILKNWDYRLTPNSAEASIYVFWENKIKEEAINAFVPIKVRPYLSSIQLKRIIEIVDNPTENFFGKNPIKARDKFIKKTFEESIIDLKNMAGNENLNWEYGQKNLKHITLNHSLGLVSNSNYSDSLNLGPLPRGGNGYTPNSTGNNLNQSSGATFRIITNTGDWDKAVGTNSPGQSGDPKSPFYRNLFKPWAQNEYFPLYYSKDKILTSTYKQTVLLPRSK
jgi:penicillin amidase